MFAIKLIRVWNILIFKTYSSSFIYKYKCNRRGLNTENGSYKKREDIGEGCYARFYTFMKFHNPVRCMNGPCTNLNHTTVNIDVSGSYPLQTQGINNLGLLVALKI